MAYTTINKSTDHFTTTTWTGDNTTPKTFTTGTFKPDWLWGKNRSQSYSHQIYDTTRGAGNDKELVSDTNGAQGASNPETYGYVSAFTSTGFTATKGTDSAGYDYWNENPDNYVAWSWKANGGTTSSNSDGSITSTVQANTTAGFSIVSYTGNATAGATVGHGLGAKPDFYILKSRDQTDSWYTYNKITGATKTLSLHSDAGETSSSFANSTEPTSSVFSLGSASAFNGNGNTFIAYCFAEKTGYSKIGSYTANGNADGNFVYTGFAPKFIIFKRKDASGYNWVIMDDKRNTYNPFTNLLLPNLNNAEIGLPTNLSTDFLSNGFKLRSASGANPTTNQGTIVYLAIGQTLVGTNNIPATAI